jgi:hypothetical protein
MARWWWSTTSQFSPFSCLSLHGRSVHVVRSLHHTFNNFHDLNQFLVHHRLAHNLHMGRQTLAHIRFICKLVSSSRHHTAQLKHPEKLTRRFILVSLLHKPPILLSICLPNP